MKVVSVNISKKRGDAKLPVEKIVVNSMGIENDAHAGDWHRQISLLAREDIDKPSAASGKISDSMGFSENITTKGMDLADISILDHLKINKVILEVTQIGKKHIGRHEKPKKNIMLKQGVFCRVLHGGIVRPGNIIKHIQNPLKIHVITLSDRASMGKYQDKSGPEIKKLLDKHFCKTRFSAAFSSALIPDEKDKLEAAVQCALNEKCDIIFTSGGTGISERDITPDVIKPMLRTEIPGIMEFIRTKYAEKIPSAMLSRSLAGITGKTLIFTLPGSVKAVSEYTREITKVINHAILSLKGIDTHRTSPNA